MDRNSTIGLIIISVLLFVYFAFFAPDAKQIAEQKAQEAAQTEAVKAKTVDPEPVFDSLLQVGNYAAIAKGEDKEYVLENKDLKITFSTKGGKITSVLVKNYLTYRKEPIYLIDNEASTMSWLLPIGNKSTNLYSLYFNSVEQQNVGDSLRLVFTGALGGNKTIQQVYTLPKEGFTVGYKVLFNGVTDLDATKPGIFTWKQQLRNFEKDAEQNRLASNVNYYTVSEEFDHLKETAKEPQTRTLEEPAKWVAFKQKFFNTAIITQDKFTKVEVASSVDMADQVFIKYLSTTMETPAANSNFKFYFGPNQYQICKKVTDGFQENVYLGWPIINNVNRFVTVPVFNFLEKFFTNYGLIILFLVIIIKLALFPLSYKSYVSMAKIRVLKPEMDEIKAKHGDDMQKVQTENLKLYQSVGVSPFSGCVPILLTMPILLAVFNFFPNSIELRQEPFLWADDLSTYDVVAKLPFTVPFYGDHISLFAFLMTISTLVYTWYNNQMSTAQMQGPMIAMSYIMPVVFLFVMNSLPAGLSYYYFVSNIITIVQQFAIRSFVDESNIRSKLEANKVKIAAQPGGGGGKQNRFMKRLEEAMKAQEEMKKKKK